MSDIPPSVYKFFKENHKCVCCGNCCNTCKSIMITNKDIKAISQCLGLSTKEFKKQYTKQYPGLTNLRCFKQENPCIFLDENNNTKKCKIYDVRPYTCRGYPFNNKHKLPDNCNQIIDLFHELIDTNGKINPESLLNANQKRNREIT